MVKLFDAHCHLQDPRIFNKVPQLIRTAVDTGIVCFAVNGITEKDWHLVKQMSESYPSIIPCFGLHPWFVTERTPNWLSTLKEFFESTPSAAVGEIGLDKGSRGREIDFTDQIEVFRQQLELAKELKRPASVHCVRAFGDLLQIMKSVGPFPDGVILHSFLGSAEMVPEFSKLGAYFSFSGFLMSMKESKAKKMLKSVPAERILLETDAPDALPKSNNFDSLFPIGGDDSLPAGFQIQGENSTSNCCSPSENQSQDARDASAQPKETLNHPANIHYVLKYVASLLEMSEEELADLSYRNALHLFSYKGSKVLLEDGDDNRSPWTRSCERKRVEGVFGAKSNKLGVNMQGRVLFKQLKTNQQDARQPVSKTAAGPSRTAPTRINFRSNIAGIVKLVTTTPLRAGHFEQLKRTPFWIMVEAIRINKLNHKEFRKYDDAILKIIRMYDARSDSFNIGGNSVKMCKSDLRLLFGIQCGTKHIDLSPCQRPTSDFIQRRSQNTARITSKLVKSLFEEAVAGRRRVDEEDAAKLLTLYMCGKMFFANSGETISWAFVRYIDDLKTVRLYDWTGAILQMLMGSIKDFHQTPEKVTGCVVALLYWICEHSTLVKPETESMFPRFMRWDIGALVTRIRGLDLSIPGKFEVRIERMKSLEYEREILATDEQEVGRRDDGVNDVVIGAGDGMQHVTHEVVDAVGVKGKDVGSVVRDAVNEVGGVTELENALKCMADMELKNKAYEGTISKLEDEVVSLKSKMEMQAVNIVGGFGCVVKVKDDEIRKLENENKELRQTISMLEDQLADQQVHTVTQAYRMNTPTGCRDVGASHCDGGSGFGVTVVHDVTPIRVGLNVGVSGDNVTVHTVSDSSPMPDRSVADVNLTDLDVGVFPNKGEGITNSFVRNLKNKARKELRLKDYDYQIVGEHEKKTVSYGCKAIGVGKGTVTDTVVDVDTVGVAAKKWSGFDLNNRFGVWKMMTYEEKEKIMKAYEQNGDGAVMWASSESGVAVYFTDVKSLVRGESICGNVIDAYAETLVTEQANVCADDVLADKSYFFSSICMSVFKSGNNQAMESYVLKNFGASKECRYIHFPICNNAHWTLVVYDAEDGSWKHFNPMRQRSAGRSDVHYNEALVLKERVSVVMKRSLRADGIDEVSIAETFNHPLEAVEDCPQQKADSLDCAVIVCAVMRQYVHHVDVARSLQGTNGIVLRANMVKGFVNDISRGLKHSN